MAFLARGNGYGLFLTPTAALVSLSKPAVRPGTVLNAQPLRNTTELRIELVGANPHPQISGRGELPGTTNYFIGKDPQKWRINVPGYESVRYQSVYPGVDLVYHGNNRQLETDFVVAPGADRNVIGFRCEGAQKLWIAPNGDLVINIEGGDIRLRKPITYQQTAGAVV